MNLAAQVKEKNKTVYQQIAEDHGVSVDYVGKIARSQRVPKKKKGLDVMNALKALTEQQ